MATPPTFVAEYESVWNSTSPKSVSVTTVANDRLVVLAIGSDSSTTLGTPTGNSLTYTLAQSVVVTDYATAYVWTATDAGGGTGWTLQVAVTAGTDFWGFTVLRFSGSDGFGASSKTNVTSGAPSLALTTTAANSAVAVANGDWLAVDGASRTWRTVNGVTPTAANGLERSYFRDASWYTAYTAYYSDAGSAAAQTYGLSAPGAQKYSIIAVEVKGTAAAAAPTLWRPRRWTHPSYRR